MSGAATSPAPAIAAAESSSNGSRRGHSYVNSPSRTQSTRTRPSALPASPQRSNSSYARPPSSGRAVEEVLPHRDQETSHVNTTSRRRSTDRPSHSRTESGRSATQYRQPSQRSHTAHMEGAASASNGHGTGSGVPADRAHGSSRAGKSRTSIPAKTGTWILGKTIGAGSMGKVKLARRQDGGEQVSGLKYCN